MASRERLARSDSTESKASLWEKFSQSGLPVNPDAPFADDEPNDLSEEDAFTSNDDLECDGGPQPPKVPHLARSASVGRMPTTTAPAPPTKADLRQPWRETTNEDRLILILNNGDHLQVIKDRIRKDLNKRGIPWSTEEDIRPWHFALTSLHLHFEPPIGINFQEILSSSTQPFWLTLKKEKAVRREPPKSNKATFQSQFPPDVHMSLRYGALLDIDRFLHSPAHCWTSREFGRCSLNLHDGRKGKSRIEWMLKTPSGEMLKKQLWMSNVDHCVVIDVGTDGFDMFICQKCNLDEFESKPAEHHSQANDQRRPAEKARPNAFHNSNRSPYHNRPSQPVPLMSLPFVPYHKQASRHGYLCRTGRSSDSTFSTIQFRLRLNQRGASDAHTRVHGILSSMIEFFHSEGLSVCYGRMRVDEGPKPYLFLRPTIPDFPSLLMRYSWQMLSIVGYRLQLQIDDEFIGQLFGLDEEGNNPDELFYRVCVYLSRIFAARYFVDIHTELRHAVLETQRKRDAAPYGLMSKLQSKNATEAYVPSVTITPTTLRIKPLKLCRTNRVLRADQYEGRLIFGEPMHSFALVDIRDENHRGLQGYHFQQLRTVLLKYLQQGFPLMGDNRAYQYLHHSQSQIKTQQFWFYHHNNSQYPRQRNYSLPEAQRWMGDFRRETNPVKCISRMALCFSTTQPTVTVPADGVEEIDDIAAEGSKLIFTDGCGTMSLGLRNQIKRKLHMGRDFSAVQFRYGGAKGVVSLDPTMSNGIDLRLRSSMLKFSSEHRLFEVCKLSAPRPVYLNRQAILLLSYRRVPDASFIILQQKTHLELIVALLRNTDAEKLILDKVPNWFLPSDIQEANIDYIHEPFFRQLLINASLNATRDLLTRTRIRVPVDEGRNMMGVVDEYRVLKPGEVFVQFTLLADNRNRRGAKERSKILNQVKVAITKNPCHHPGDIRTFIAMDYPELRHLKDVIVFSQQGDRPAPHDISGSDLDGDEYIVLWEQNLVPQSTDNADPYDYDANIPESDQRQLRVKEELVLEISEQDYLGRLSNLHLAFADKFGVDNNQRKADVRSTMELAAAISQEVDSAKTGYHPVNDEEMKRLTLALEGERPDFMDKSDFKRYESRHVLGTLFRASKKMLPGWKRLLRYHRDLRHLQVRTSDEIEELDEEESTSDTTERRVELDPTLIADVDQTHENYGNCQGMANRLVFIYRQEILEILHLYGLSHESDLWCRNTINATSGEFEDTALTELEQLVARTRSRFYLESVVFCQGKKCDENANFEELCRTCQKLRRSLSVACYCASYGDSHSIEQGPPILSLPWLFATYLLRGRLTEEIPPMEPPLNVAMERALEDLIRQRHGWLLGSQTLLFVEVDGQQEARADVDTSICVFIEILDRYVRPPAGFLWPSILTEFLRGRLSPPLPDPLDQWTLRLPTGRGRRDDTYAGILRSMEWNPEINETMRCYFDNILGICFKHGREANGSSYLNISEKIILLLQRMAIKETIFEV